MATEVAPTRYECLERLSILDRLRRLLDDGTLKALVETRVEQSFNERLFAEVFDYRTLLRDGSSEYHLQPKEYSSASGQYDDFSLGHFGPGGGGGRRVSAELKGLTIDLDAPQAGREDKKTPVQQAHGAAVGESGIVWVIVSNYDEMRLYRAGELDAFERIYLTDLNTVEDLCRAYALFGRPSLLGEENNASPLDREYNAKDRTMLDMLPGRARLIHEASVSEDVLQQLRQDPVPLHVVDDALRAMFLEMGELYQSAQIPWWPARDAAYGMKLEDGKLRVRQVTDDGLSTLIDASPAGLVRVWEHIGSPHNATVVVTADDIARRMAAFVHFAGRVLHVACETSVVRFRWSMHDLDGAKLEYPGGWCEGIGTPLRGTAETTGSGWIGVDFGKQAEKVTVTSLTSALRELLFPFEGNALEGGVVRLNPSPESLKQVVWPSLAAALRISAAS